MRKKFVFLKKKQVEIKVFVTDSFRKGQRLPFRTEKILRRRLQRSVFPDTAGSAEDFDRKVS